jgi:hypothetical protein
MKEASSVIAGEAVLLETFQEPGIVVKKKAHSWTFRWCGVQQPGELSLLSGTESSHKVRPSASGFESGGERGRFSRMTVSTAEKNPTTQELE